MVYFVNKSISDLIKIKNDTDSLKFKEEFGNNYIGGITPSKSLLGENSNDIININDFLKVNIFFEKQNIEISFPAHINMVDVTIVRTFPIGYVLWHIAMAVLNIVTPKDIVLKNYFISYLELTKPNFINVNLLDKIK